MKTVKARTKKPAPKTKAKVTTAAGHRRGSGIGPTTRTTPPTLSSVLSIVGKLQAMTDHAIHSDTDTFEQLKARYKDMIAKRRQRATSKDDTRDAAAIRADVNEMQEEAVRFAQATRKATGDPHGLTRSIIARMCVFLGEDRWMFDDQATRDVMAKMSAFKKRKGLHEDDEWLKGEAPDEYLALEAESDACYDAVIVKVMRDHGEHDLARMYLEDRDGFDQLMDVGREKIADAKGTKS